MKRESFSETNRGENLLFNTMLKRIIKSGTEKFLKDKIGSGAMLLVIAALLGTLTFLFFLQGVSAFVVSNLQQSVDMSVYLQDDAQQDDIAKLKAELAMLPEVGSVRYVSKDDALKQFTALHQNDQAILDSLDALGTNPFFASLRVGAKDSSQYKKIADFLTQHDFTSVIQSIDYQERASVIEKVTRLTSALKTGAFALSAVFACIALLVAFNTIRLTILNSREEIEIMRLVGASNSFIRGPFLVQGAIAGLLGGCVLFLLTLLFSWYAGSRMQSFLGGFNMLRYFFSYLWAVILLQFGVGIALSVFSSFIAIRKYLKK